MNDPRSIGFLKFDSVRAFVVGVVAAGGYAYVAARFLCCRGEDGFAANVADTALVAAVLLPTAMAVQPGWRSRPLAAMATGAVLFLAVGAIVLFARPGWSDYVAARPLHLYWRTAAVLAAATGVAFLHLRWIAGSARDRASRRRSG